MISGYFYRSMSNLTYFFIIEKLTSLTFKKMRRILLTSYWPQWELIFELLLAHVRGEMLSKYVEFFRVFSPIKLFLLQAIEYTIPRLNTEVGLRLYLGFYLKGILQSGNSYGRVYNFRDEKLFITPITHTLKYF